MTTIPTMIPAAVRSRMERAEARRAYAELSDSLNETFDDLYTAADHDERAALLDFAAQVTCRLADLHTAAWGPDADADGQPMADSLTSSAALLGQVAATERAVIGAGPPLQRWIGDAVALQQDQYAAELMIWVRLAHTCEPGQRAAYLHRLRDLTAGHLGDTAAEILAVLAEIEIRRAAGQRRPEPPTWWFTAPRIVIGAFFAALAAIVAVPGLEDGTRDVLAVALLAVVAVFFGGLWLIARRGSGAR
ncbi:hypothetical protein [Actinomadura sp. 3N407]|uniref:hypothetical protein n=1 Tax=Actinomadura sp. 3N407 TaxID=3457423 RepID=UPI003FCD026E